MNNKERKTYINMLNNNSIGINEIMNYTEKFVPSKLYRYMGFGDWWKVNLFKGKIHLSAPKDFNDPFDSVPFVDFKEFWQKYGNEMYQKNNGCALPLKEGLTDEQCYPAFKEMIDFAQENMRVCCFTENKDSLLMWAHYANSHRGFCIEYNTEIMPSNIKKYILPVIYQHKIYNATHDFKYDENNAFNFLLFKSDDWEYEKEWRIAVYYKQISKELDFSKYISSVFLGINCDDKNKQEILHWSKSNGINVYQETIDYKGYNVVMKII